MNKTLILIVFSFIIISCSSTPKNKMTDSVTEESEVKMVNDGTSCEKAVIIDEEDELSGVDIEYRWLNENYPDHKLNNQSTVKNKSKNFDVMEITTETGEKKTIYFDISKFYGKY